MKNNFWMPTKKGWKSGSFSKYPNKSQTKLYTTAWRNTYVLINRKFKKLQKHGPFQEIAASQGTYILLVSAPSMDVRIARPCLQCRILRLLPDVP